MGTGATGYGNGVITTATPARVLANGFIPTTGSLDVILPSDMLMYFGQSAAAEYVQFRVNTTVTCNVNCYLTWKE